jgi:hypothetical protein
MGDATDLPGGQDRDDVRLLQGRRDPNLTAEPFDEDLTSHFGRQDLDDDLPTERRFVGHKDPRHPATYELTLDNEGAAKCRLELRA